MSDYLARSELPPVDRTAVRATAPVQAVQPVSSSRATADATRDVPQDVEDTASGADSSTLDGGAASAAEYAQVHARIANILADLHARGGIDVDGVTDAMQAMIPVPIVLVPLPPASREAVEYAAALAKRMVAQASYAYAAHAVMPRGVVDQVASTGN